jgi:hypothetical protein
MLLRFGGGPLPCYTKYVRKVYVLVQLQKFNCLRTRTKLQFGLKASMIADLVVQASPRDTTGTGTTAGIVYQDRGAVHRLWWTSTARKPPVPSCRAKFLKPDNTRAAEEGSLAETRLHKWQVVLPL